MTPLAEAPHIKINRASTKAILECVENGKMGFSLVLEENDMLHGLVSSADIRKALLAKIDTHQSITPEDLIKALDNTTKKIGIAWVVDTSKIKQISQ